MRSAAMLLRLRKQTAIVCVCDERRGVCRRVARARAVTNARGVAKVNARELCGKNLLGEPTRWRMRWIARGGHRSARRSQCSGHRDDDVSRRTRTCDSDVRGPTRWESWDGPAYCVKVYRRVGSVHCQKSSLVAVGCGRFALKNGHSRHVPIVEAHFGATPLPSILLAETTALQSAPLHLARNKANYDGIRRAGRVSLRRRHRRLFYCA